MTFASVLQYTDESVKQCRELANFLRKRSQVEMEYAKGLYKLSQSFPRPSGAPGSTSQVSSPSSTPATSRSASIADGALFGGLSRIGVVPTVSPQPSNEVVGTSVWNAFYEYVDGITKMAEGHRTLALNLQNNVLDAFSNLIKDMDAVRKSQADRGAGYIKNLQDAYSGLKKAKKEYNTAKVAAQESQNAHQKARATHHSRERDLDKLASRASSALDKADYANEALRVCEEICKNAQEHYYGHLLPVLYDEIRKNELDRCASVKKALVDSLYLEKLYGGDARLAAIDSATDRLTHIDINEDVEAFVDSHMIDEPGKKEHNVSVSMLVNPVKAGRMLLKRGDFIAGWKSRYFVLMAENGLLYCFDDEAALKPREVITLHMCSIHPLDDSYFGRANCLQVMCIGDTARGRQTYNLITESGQEKEEWLRALQRFTFCCTKAAYSALEEVGAAAHANAKVDADDSSSMMSRSTGALASAVRDVLPNISPDDLDAVQIVRTFQISILDAKELPSSPGLGDVRPYCIVLFDDVKQARTMTKSGDAPFWGEEFEFGDFCPHFSRLRIVLFNQNRLQRDVDLGYVSIQLQGVEPGTRVEQWYSIKQLPRGAGSDESTSSPSGKRTGSIRIGFCLSVQQVLPMRYYQQFLDAVTEPNLVCVKMLGAVCGSQREALAKKLIHVLAARNAEIQGLSTLLDDEIASTDNPNIIFRGNSLATKAVDQYMKLVGGTYLSETLTAWVRTVYSSREACEVDPTRVDSAEVLVKNWRRLMGFVNSVWDVIRSSATSCPQEFVAVFGHIRSAVEKKWPVETEPQSSSVQYASISGFLFLRFFCPAILNPKLFGLVPEHPDPPIARTLTLVAKTLQNLANLSDFGSKEGYMSECNTFIDSNMDAMKNFIDQVSGRGALQPSQLPTWSGQRTPLQVRQDAENLYTFFLSNMDSLQRECGTAQGPYVEDCVRAVRIVRDHHADLDFKDDVEYPPKISSRKSSIVSIASDRVPELPPRLELLGLDGIATPTHEVPPHKPATNRQSRHFGLALSNRGDTTEHANGSFEDIQLILERMGSTEGASFPQHDAIPAISVRQASLDSHPGSPTYAAPALPIPPPRTRSRSGGSMRTSQSLNTLSYGALETHVEEPPMPPSQHTYSRKKSVAKGFLRHFLPGNHNGSTGELSEVSPVSPRQFFGGGSTRRRGSEDAVWMPSGGRTKASPGDYHMSQPVRNAKGPRPSLDSVISSSTHDAPESPHVPNPDIVDTYPPPRPPTPSSSSTSLSSKTDKEKGNKSRWSVIWKGSSGSLHNGN
ncbi:Ras GTPase-activating protein 1 [Gaertneriomyces sp. JEL0708]|nr:Ras GTPase-activating protein 1 [Gaertneriomyces sp. JEL0708]